MWKIDRKNKHRAVASTNEFSPLTAGHAKIAQLDIGEASKWLEVNGVPYNSGLISPEHKYTVPNTIVMAMGSISAGLAREVIEEYVGKILVFIIKNKYAKYAISPASAVIMASLLLKVMTKKRMEQVARAWNIKQMEMIRDEYIAQGFRVEMYKDASVGVIVQAVNNRKDIFGFWFIGHGNCSPRPPDPRPPTPFVPNTVSIVGKLAKEMKSTDFKLNHKLGRVVLNCCFSAEGGLFRTALTSTNGHFKGSIGIAVPIDPWR